jgi:WD40 repeat protein
MTRTAARLRAEGAAVAILDLTAFGRNLTLEQWYDALLTRAGRGLDRGPPSRPGRHPLRPLRGRELLTLKGHTSWVTSTAFSSDGKRIVTASNDNTVRVWISDPDAGK